MTVIFTPQTQHEVQMQGAAQWMAICIPQSYHEVQM